MIKTYPKPEWEAYEKPGVREINEIKTTESTLHVGICNDAKETIK